MIPVSRQPTLHPLSKRRTKTAPKDQCQIFVKLSLFAQFQKRCLPCFWLKQLGDEDVDLLLVAPCRGRRAVGHQKNLASGRSASDATGARSSLGLHGRVDGLLGAGGRWRIVQVLGEILREQWARGGCARRGRLGCCYLGGVCSILPRGVCGGRRVGELAPVEEVGGDV